MIRIIKGLSALSLDDTEAMWKPLPMVPASASIKKTDNPDSSGRLMTIEISATISQETREMRDHLSIRIDYDSGESEFYGTADLPVTFDIKEESSVLTISAKYQTSQP